MNEYRIRQAHLIAAETRVPGDLEISHRAVLIAALANGPSVITGFLPADECLATVQACRALGVKIEFLAPDSGEPLPPGDTSTTLRIHGRSRLLTEPAAAVDCGTSATGVALLCGILAGQPFASRLTATGPLSHPALSGIAAALHEMGVSFGPRPALPLSIPGHAGLQAIEHRQPAASTLVKEAALLAGLFAAGRTVVTAPPGSHDHLERILGHFQVKTLRQRTKRTVTIYGGQMPESRDFHIPGDISCAANWIVAAAAQPGSELIIRRVGLNPSRTGFVRVLVRMGAQILEDIHGGASGEPPGTLIVRGAPLRATNIPAEEAASLTEELPLLAVAASLAKGASVLHHPPGDPDRLMRTAHHLRLMGVEVTTRSGSIEIKGGAGAALQPGCVPSGGDIRLAMAMAVAGFFTEGETIVEDTACVESVYHGFHLQLRRFQDRHISEGIRMPLITPAPAKTPGRLA